MINEVSYEIGRFYKRSEIIKIAGDSNHAGGGAWSTGYRKFKNQFYIFANIGVPGRTGQNYPNIFKSRERLQWYTIVSEESEWTSDLLQ